MLREPIMLIPIGTAVIVGDDIDATITHINMAGISMEVTYTAEWWDDRRLMHGTFFLQQLKLAEVATERQSIGFVTR